MKRRLCLGKLLVLVALSVAVFAAVLAAAGCSSSSPALTTSTHSAGSSASVSPISSTLTSFPTTATSTTSTPVSPPTSTTVSTANPARPEFPLGKPVDVIRRTSAPWVWNAVVADHTVAYVESESYGFPYLGSPQPPQTAVIKTLDLETGKASVVPGSEPSSPKWSPTYLFWPWWFLAALPQANSQATGPSLLWALGNTQYSGDGITRWQDLTGWNSSTGMKAVLSPETMTLPPIRSGDILALPLTSPAYENAHGGTVGPTLGEKLFVLTTGLNEPIAVNPAAPILPAAALKGISPYVSWSGWLLGRVRPDRYAGQFRTDLPGEPPRVFDLRSGRLVDITVKDPRTPSDWRASVVADRWAAWAAIESGSGGASLYLADLSTGRAQRLIDRSTSGPIGIALSKDWLLWTDASGNLLGYHLPDLTRVRVPGVLTSDEKYATLQISGDLAVLMAVGQAQDALGPSRVPTLTAIRVVRLR